MSERRRQPRSGLSLRAAEHVGGARRELLLSQLGAGGFFVAEPACARRPGELVVIELDDAGAPAGLRLTGEVAHVSELGFGVRITRADWDRLRALLDRAASGR